MTTQWNHRLAHDVAWRAAEGIMAELLKTESPDDYRQVFLALYERVRAAIDTYCVRQHREKTRLGAESGTPTQAMRLREDDPVTAR